MCLSWVLKARVSRLLTECIKTLGSPVPKNLSLSIYSSRRIAWEPPLAWGRRYKCWWMLQVRAFSGRRRGVTGCARDFNLRLSSPICGRKLSHGEKKLQEKGSAWEKRDKLPTSPVSGSSPHSSRTHNARAARKVLYRRGVVDL